MTARTLVVVDMQKGFLDDMLYPEADGTVPDQIKHNRLIMNVRELVKYWKRTGDPIVFLEFKIESRRHSKTLRHLTRGLEGYDVYTVLKRENDGSKELHECITKNSLPKGITVAGINTDACVMETIEGLYKINQAYDVELVKGCTTNVYDYNTFEESIALCKRCVRERITVKTMGDYDLVGHQIPSEPIYRKFGRKALACI